MIPGSADLVDAIYNTRDVAVTYISSRSTNPITGFRDVGDWDGDGVHDLGVSFAQDGFNGTSDGGLAWMVPSQIGEGNFSDNDVSTIEGDSDYNQVKYGNMIISRPIDINGDGISDWVASDWSYLGSSGSSTNLGGIYISYQE